MRRKLQPMRVLVLAVSLLVSGSGAQAGVEVVAIEKVQVVGGLSGVVNDPSGVPLPHVKIEEVSPDWKTVFQTAETDENGHFAVAPPTQRKVYYLVFSCSGFNPMRIRVRIKPGSAKRLTIQLVIST